MARRFRSSALGLLPILAAAAAFPQQAPLDLRAPLAAAQIDAIVDRLGQALDAALADVR